MTWAERIDARLAEVRAAGRWRTVRTLSDGPVRAALADGTEVVSFASNDYLGLSHHPDVRAAAIDAVGRWGTGSGSARLITGGRPIHDELEAALAEWKGTEAALLFPTGYQANVGALTALAAAAGPGAVILSDEWNHASIIDGARLSRAEVIVFPHNDVDAVAVQLDRHRGRPAIVVADLVFSMDGDLADVDGLHRVCAASGALLVLDAAHVTWPRPVPDHGGTGGPEADVAETVIVGTMSKTLGSIGGFVAGSTRVIDLLRNTARSFIFTTASPPADAASALAALRVLQGPEGALLLGRLRHNVDLLRPGHPSPIVPVVLGSEERALSATAALLERGMLVPAIRPPTVPVGASRLRVTVSAAHHPADLLALRHALEELGVDLAAGPALSDPSTDLEGRHG